MSYLRGYRFYLACALIFAVASVGLTLYAPILTGQAVDLVIGKSNVDFERLIVLVVIFIAVITITGVLQWIMALFINRISYGISRSLRKEAFEKLINAPLSKLDRHSRGDLISRIVNDVEIVSDGLITAFSQLFTGIMTIIGTLVFMFTIDPLITLIVVILTPMSLFVAAFIAKRSSKSFKEEASSRGDITSFAEEFIASQKLVKAFSFEDEAQERFEKLSESYRKSTSKSLLFSSFTNPATRFINNLVYAGVGVFGAISALNGNLSVGQLSCFLSYANQYTKPFNEISSVITEFQSAIASAKRIFETIDMEQESSDEDKKELCDIRGDIDIENVSFSYVPEKPLIKNLNLAVEKNQRIAIVGPTGCGKTTIINLLMRFYDVNSGQILVSGERITGITRSSLRKSYGMVLQETWLKSGTIFENISYSKPDATMEEVIAAAKAAKAHSFIMRLPNRYETVISDDAANISQGEKQLLCIARVMLSLPPMLILDEATSSIDTITEMDIQHAFRTMMKGRTSFIVAHRLSTIKEADCILVMKDGNIIEQGTHDELVGQNGFYAELYRSQFRF